MSGQQLSARRNLRHEIEPPTLPMMNYTNNDMQTIEVSQYPPDQQSGFGSNEQISEPMNVRHARPRANLNPILEQDFSQSNRLQAQSNIEGLDLNNSIEMMRPIQNQHSTIEIHEHQ